ncbi:MAG: DUF374 domain-containing protein, partial [Gemmatimonadota bacterium]|nr:DUF374 domain-containing protein [Gemmatimonadota bacterium]
MSRGRASGKQIARAVDLVVRTLGHSVVLSLGTTWRVRHVGRENAVRARSMGGPVIYAFTHGVLLPLVYTHRRRGIHILASQSRDGDRIAAVAGHLGYESVRGSSSRGGREALARLVECAKAGHDLGITPDGPRGPRGSVSPGVVVMASRAGVPIL